MFSRGFSSRVFTGISLRPTSIGPKQLSLIGLDKVTAQTHTYTHTHVHALPHRVNRLSGFAFQFFGLNRLNCFSYKFQINKPSLGKVY